MSTPTATHHFLRAMNLQPLMSRSEGRPEVGVALVDGPVAVDHPALAHARIESIGGTSMICSQSDSSACGHGTFVAGILVAGRSSGAPAVSPGCTLMVRPIFVEPVHGDGVVTATPRVAAEAIVESVDAGARVINLSAGVSGLAGSGEAVLIDALNHAANRGVIVVAAVGNQATVGSSAITGHYGVIPVVAYDRAGRPSAYSNLSGSAGRRGVGAPGDSVTSLAATGGMTTQSGTSFATAFVTGTLALLWSLFPRAHANELRNAVASRRPSVVPSLLDAEQAYRRLLASAQK